MNKSQAEIDAIAAENRMVFRNRLRENKRKIELAAESRPSLLIRHDQVRSLIVNVVDIVSFCIDA